MRFVFYKHQLTWPRQSGHDVHSAEMMRARADALISLWDDPQRRRQLGAAARAWVTERHSWAAAADLALRGIESMPAASGR
jgi:hypothetical protein